MKIDKLKEIVLILVAFILMVFLIKYLNIFKYVKILFNVLVPLFIGFIYAWIFNPLIVKLGNKKRGIVCVVVFLTFIMLFGLFIYYVIPLFYKEMIEMIGLIPNIVRKVEIKVEVLGFKDYLEQVVSYVVNKVPNILIDLISGIFKYVGVIVIGLILGLYISFDYEKIINKIYMYIPVSYKCIVVNLSKKVSDTVRKCINGLLLIASFVFILDSLAFMVIGMDSPILLGIICGITDLIPYIGPYIGGVIAVLVGLTESKRLGLLTLIVCIIVQSIENYILQPIIMSKSIKISPIFVIMGLLVFGKFFGVIGMILAMPILAMLKVLIEHFVDVYKKCKKNRA